MYDNNINLSPRQLDLLRDRVSELANDITELQRLQPISLSSSLNKVRYITEKVLDRICDQRQVDCGRGPRTLESMLGPLTHEGLLAQELPHLRTIQIYTNLGSHYQQHPPPFSYLKIAQDALVEFLCLHFKVHGSGLEEGHVVAPRQPPEAPLLDNGRLALRQLIAELGKFYSTTPLMLRSYLADMSLALGLDVVGFCFRGRRLLEVIQSCSHKEMAAHPGVKMHGLEQIVLDIEALDREYTAQLAIVRHTNDAWLRLVHGIAILMSIVRWFLEEIYPNMERDDFEVIFETDNRDLSPAEFNRRTIEFNQLFFGPESARPHPEEYLDLNRKNPHLFLYAIARATQDVVGALEVIPLDDAFLERLERETSMDALLQRDEFPEESVRSFDKPGVYSLFVDTVATHPQYRRSPHMISALLRAYIVFLMNLLDRGILIRNVYAEAWSDAGAHLCTMFGMNQVRKTQQGALYKRSLTGGRPPCERLMPVEAEKYLLHNAAALAAASGQGTP